MIASLQLDSKLLKAILGNVATPKSVLILIGPEGDFTPAELGLAKSAGCLPLSLGPLVLRAETAAIYALSILHHELQTRVLRPYGLGEGWPVVRGPAGVA